jgi:hypothetical protein
MPFNLKFIFYLKGRIGGLPGGFGARYEENVMQT